jgi:hypothetical protein
VMNKQAIISCWLATYIFKQIQRKFSICTDSIPESRSLNYLMVNRSIALNLTSRLLRLLRLHPNEPDFRIHTLSVIHNTLVYVN